MDFQSYSVQSFRKIPQVESLREEQRFDIDVVSRVLPFKVNNFQLLKMRSG